MKAVRGKENINRNISGQVPDIVPECNRASQELSLTFGSIEYWSG